jgi:hypothetical protein
MNNGVKLMILTISLLCLFTAALTAQATDDSPCARPEFRQFDFWLGDWDCTGVDTDSTGAETFTLMHNRVTVILDSCVIKEEFDGRPASPLRGQSFSTFDTQLGKWRQVWVDNTGAYLDFIGEFNDGMMDLRRTATRHDSTFVQRILYKNITPDSMTWQWERSDDNGETWRVLWTLFYTRREH